MWSVYVHFPWCVRKCPYCDFATQALPLQDIPHAAYADAVLRELDAALEAATARGLSPRLHSIFFGGGTPSLWHASHVRRVIAALHQGFGVAAGSVEVSAECNPNSLREAQAAALVEAGVGRLSIGVQSLRSRALTHLGRAHNPAEARAAVRHAVRHAPRVSADLIFGLPMVSSAEQVEDARALIDLGIEHLSAYALTIEAQTPFGALHRRGQLPVAQDSHHIAGYLGLAQTLLNAGFTHYEVSNYARPGAAAQHNLHTWQGGLYLGLGAAAVGCLDAEPSAGGPSRRLRYRNIAKPADYLAQVGTSACRIWQEELDAQAQVREALMLGLRLEAGVDLQRLQRSLGIDPRVGRERAFARAQSRGLLVATQAGFRVPQARWLQLDGIIAGLF
ncbi:MAG: radical SAM family heme chaperone HemW [Polyangiales bacterium]